MLLPSAKLVIFFKREALQASKYIAVKTPAAIYAK